MKRRILATILAITLVTGFAAYIPEDTVVQAAETEGDTKVSGDFLYEVLEDNTVKIVKYTGEDSELIVPEELEGKTVSKFGKDMIKECENLLSIHIPKTVTEIEANSEYCGPFSWDYDSVLQEIHVDEENQIYSSIDGILYNKEQTTMLRCPMEYQKEEVIIPDTVTTIGADTFWRNMRVVKVHIPKTVKTIEINAWAYCKALEEINVEEGSSYYSSEDGVLYRGSGEWMSLEKCPQKKKGSVTIKEGTTSIGAVGFNECVNIESVLIPNTVTFIQNGAFTDCEKLQTITIPASVTQIGDTNTFSYCDALKEIIVDENNPNYSSVDGVLYSKDLHELISYPPGKEGEAKILDSVITIGRSAFYTCTRLTHITLPEGVTTIGVAAFGGYPTYLRSISIPKSAIDISPAAFTDCSALRDIFYEGTAAEWQAAWTGDASALENVLLHYNCVDGYDVLGYTVEELSEDTVKILSFFGGYDHVRIPETLRDKTVTEISSEFFQSSYPYKSITIPKTVTKIERQAEDKEPLPKANVEAIYVAEENAHYASEDGILYNKDKTELLLCPREKSEEITIPEGVTSIGARAFADCRNLTRISIPKTVKQIGESAFTKATSLMSISVDEENENYSSDGSVLYDKNQETVIACPAGMEYTVYLPGTVKTIAPYAFAYGNATGVHIPEGVTTIGDFAFCGNRNIERIMIPGSVTDIGSDRVFYDCVSLSEIKVYAENPNYASEEGVLYNKDKTTLLVYPKRKWGEVVLADTIKHVEDYAFAECNAIDKVVLPEGVTTIGEKVFCGCINMNTLGIPKTLTGKLNGMFEGCLTLKDVYYSGSEEDWKLLWDGDDAILSQVTVHFHANLAELLEKEENSDNDPTPPTTGGDTDDDPTPPTTGGDTDNDPTPPTTGGNTNNDPTSSTGGGNTDTTQTPSVTEKMADMQLEYAKVTYSGKTYKPTVVVKDAKGNVIPADKYDVAYKNNKNVGQATVTITGKGDAAGTLTATFNIVPKGTSITKVAAKKKGFSVKWKKQLKQTSGYEIQYSTSKKFKGAKITKVKKNKTTSVTLKKLKAKKKYYVRIRTYKTVKINGKSVKMYSDWSKAKNVVTKK